MMLYFETFVEKTHALCLSNLRKKLQCCSLMKSPGQRNLLQKINKDLLFLFEVLRKAGSSFPVRNF